MGPETPAVDNFTEYRRLILGELERLSTAVIQLSGKIDSIRDSDLTAIRANITKELTAVQIDVAMLKVKMGLIAAAAGLLSGSIGALIVKLVSKP